MIAEALSNAAVGLVERGLVPDSITRAGIRRLLRRRLAEERSAGASVAEFARGMRSGPIAPVPEKANEQHYEVPAAFFREVLGPHLKYSCAYYEDPESSLEDAEAAALALTCSHADLADGQTVLELGCGWGSLTLFMAERYPASRITAVSNSASQRAFILGRAKELGLGNLEVITADMNEFDTAARFDRVVSVEMFEHMRNWGGLLDRVAGWLRPDGKFFAHVFRHRDLAYRFAADGPANWMGRHFFTGGIMPSRDLFDRFGDRLTVAERWDWNGAHYAKTSNAWLENLDRRRAAVLPVLEETYGKRDAKIWLRRWRIFFMACAELFAFDDGEQWGVSHYLLEPRSAPVVAREAT